MFYPLALLLCLLPAALYAADKTVGTYHYTYGPLSIYDATLTSPGGTYNPQQPFTLSLAYHHGIASKQLVDGCLKEWHKQNYAGADISAWTPKLIALLPDVANGDVISDTHTTGGISVSKNGADIGHEADPRFVEAFFSLWLGANQSTTAQYHALTGR